MTTLHERVGPADEPSVEAGVDGCSRAALADLSPEVLRALDAGELRALCREIRGCILATVSENGGHLGSNLGAVELTVSLHRVFDSPRDPIVWDTGHQAYTHKLITGRAAAFGELRRAGGMSGYPNRSESGHDFVENSHASTGLSYADGLARARDLQGGQHHVVCVVGDGALTGGLAYEALSSIGFAQRRVVIVLNDNGRSYSPTVSRLTTAAARRDQVGVDVGAGVGVGVGSSGEGRDGTRGDAEGLGSFERAPRNFFDALGIGYLGPIDGHDMDALESALRSAAAWERPVVVHVHTVKGLGYAPAELDEEKCLHDVAPFHVSTGLPKVPKGSVPTYTEAFSSAIVTEAEHRPELVAVTAAMTGPTGLGAFSRRFGTRLVDAGIAEAHAVTAAAGMAMGGLRPVVAIYSTFINRSWDQILFDVGLHRLPVVFCLDRAGVTGDDGPSHHGVFDLALLSKVPHMTVLAPSSYEEVAVMLHDALELTTGPVAIRWPKTTAPRSPVTGHGLSARRARQGDGSVCLLGVGKLFGACEHAARLLAADGIEATLWDVRVATPLDQEMLADAARHRVVVSAEDGIATGGIGAAISAALHSRTAAPVAGAPTGQVPPRVVVCGLPLDYLAHGKADRILSAHGLDAAGIAGAATRALRG